MARTIQQIQNELAGLPNTFSLSSRGANMVGGDAWIKRKQLEAELKALQQTAAQQPLQDSIAAEGEQRVIERGEAKAAVQPAVEAAVALPTQAISPADIARQQAQSQAQLMGGAAGFTASPFSGRQQSMAQSATMAAQGQYAQIAPQIELAGNQANMAAQQARAAQMGVVGVGLASALQGVPTTMTPYQASTIAMQAGQQAGYGSGNTMNGFSSWG